MKLFYLLLLSLSGFVGYGQFNYQAVNAINTTGTYTDLGTSGTAITTNFGGGAITFDDDVSSIQNIGFSFVYNGSSFTQFILSTNGFIRLGSAVPDVNTNTTFDVLNSVEVNTIAPFNVDLDAGTSPEYRVLTSGAVGSRVTTIQYEGIKDYSSTTGQFSNMNFQIKLYETSNNIEFVYGTFTPTVAAPAFITPVVGVMGSTPAISVNATKTSATAWSAATFINGAYTGNYFNVRNNVLPDAGRTLRFVAAVLPANDAKVEYIYTLGQLPFFNGYPHVISALVTNAGSTTLTNLLVTLNISGSNTFSNTQNVASLAPGVSTVVSFAAFTASAAGTNNITVSVPADNVNTNNSISAVQTTSGGSPVFSYADNSAMAGSIGYATGSGLILTKYNMAGTGIVNSVRVFISDDVNNPFKTVYAVLLNSAGTIIAQSNNTVLAAGDISTYKTFNLTVPQSITNADFYVGLAQTANAISYFPVGLQDEGNPTRSGAYYIATLTGSGLVQNNTLGRFMIQALLAGTVPVNLLEFTAAKNGSQNVLRWKTDNEINLNSYVIERSADGRNFSSIGSIRANNSVGVNQYNFPDIFPVKGTNYYRLRSVDQDRLFSFSAIRSVFQEQNHDLAIFPNPVKNNLSFMVDVEENVKAVLQILSLDGKLYKTESIALIAGSGRHHINVNELPQGNYILKIIFKNKVLTSSFVK